MVFPCLLCLLICLLCDWRSSSALVLEHVQNLEAFAEPDYNTPIRFKLLLSPDELETYGRAEMVTLCLVVNGGVCQCTSNKLASLGITLHEKCRPAPSWSSYFISLLLSLPDFQDMRSSNPLVVYHTPSPLIDGNNGPISSETVENSQLPRPHTDHQPFYFDRITFLLLVTLDDLSRATVLLRSLQAFVRDASLVQELVVFTPDDQLRLVAAALSGFNSSLAFPIRILPDSILFHQNYSAWPHKDPYAVQMAIKLMAAKVIRTFFYLTFDADIVQLHPFSLRDIIHSVSVQHGPTASTANGVWRQVVVQQRAVYHHESYRAHPHWWDGSKFFLNMDDTDNDRLAFGVTPALLSTWGSLLTVGRTRMTIGTGIPSQPFERSLHIADCLGANAVMLRACHRQFLDNFNQEEVERIWVVSLGVENILWTEYTLYRVVLTNYHVFDQLHVREEEAGVFLHCNNVWYAHELPWKGEEAFANSSCLFSVVQSTTGVSPGKVLRAFEQARLQHSKIAIAA